MTSRTLAEIRTQPFAHGITFKMPAQMREKWLKALRSGLYKQGEGMLQRPEGSYCCLGVLQKVTDGDVQRNGDRSCGLPTAEWYDSHGVVTAPGQITARLQVPFQSLTDDAPVRWPLDALNDSLRLTFTQLADLIEKHSEGY